MSAPAAADAGLFVAFTTVATAHDAERLAELAVSAGLAACVRIHGVRSIYSWKGELQRDEEFELAFKTTAAAHDALMHAVLAAHPYELPAWHALPAARAGAAYAAWVNDALKPPFDPAASPPSS